MLDIVKETVFVCCCVILAALQGPLHADASETTLHICQSDDSGYLCRAARPDGVTIEVDCDSDGRKRSVDIRGPNGQYVRTFQYNYPSEQSYSIHEQRPDGVVVTREFEQGHLKHYFSTDGSVDYSFEYDQRGQVISARDHVHGHHVLREVDASGRICKEMLGTGLQIGWHYNSDGQRDCVFLHDGSKISYRYKGYHLEAIHRVDATGELCYSHSYQLKDNSQVPDSLELIGQAGRVQIEWTPDGRVLSSKGPYWRESLNQRDDNLGDVTVRVTDEDAAGFLISEFLYDDEDQVVEESGVIKSSYAYDIWGNRVLRDEVWSAIDDDLLLTEDSEGRRWEYDSTGNPVLQIAEGRRLELGYDALNRLTEVLEPGVAKWCYGYDAFNRRVMKREYRWERGQWVQSEETRYLYDRSSEIAAVNSDGSFRQLRVLGVGLGGDMGAAVAIEIDGHAYAPVHDYRGNVRCLVDAQTGELAELYRYSAFGITQIFDSEGNPLSDSQVGNPWRFASKRCDAETGWSYFGQRYYQANQGRWLTPDPMGVLESPNRYLFAQNNPIDRIDPTGMFSVPRFLADLGGSIWDSVANLFAASGRMYAEFVDYFDAHTDFRDTLQDINDNLQGGAFFILTGQNFEETHIGVVGNGEISNKVRLTYTNGILNTAEDCVQAAEAISACHGQVNVHYLYKATQGYSWEILRTGLGKLGLVSYEARALADLWQSLIQDMGGSQSGGQIIHYAHSSGGTDTANALSLLSETERRLIKVHTFGSPTIISPNIDCEAYNYVSVRDGVPLFGMLTNFSDAIFVGSFLDGFPFIDHFFDGDTYQNIWRQEGEAFVEMYGSL